MQIIKIRNNFISKLFYTRKFCIAIYFKRLKKNTEKKRISCYILYSSFQSCMATKPSEKQLLFLVELHNFNLGFSNLRNPMILRNTVLEYTYIKSQNFNNRKIHKNALKKIQNDQKMYLDKRKIFNFKIIIIKQLTRRTSYHQ